MEKISKKPRSVRIPEYIIKYAKQHNISFSKLVGAGFDVYRENDYRHAMERLRYHEERVLHWKQIVVQHEQESTTKYQFCSTIKEMFLEHGRGSLETKRQDLSWLEPRVVDLQKKGIPISLDELYNFCIDKKEVKEELNKYE